MERATRVPAQIWAAGSQGKQSDQTARTHRTTIQCGWTSAHTSRRTRAHVFGQVLGEAGTDPLERRDRKYRCWQRRARTEQHLTSNCGHGVSWKHGEVKVKLISCAAKVQHCQETDRHTAVTDVCPDSQRFHLTWFGKRGVAENIRFDSFIDDLSSVDSKGLNHPDCEVLVRINKQSLTLQVVCTSARMVLTSVLATRASSSGTRVMRLRTPCHTHTHTLHGTTLKKPIDRRAKEWRSLVVTP